MNCSEYKVPSTSLLHNISQHVSFCGYGFLFVQPADCRVTPCRLSATHIKRLGIFSHLASCKEFRWKGNGAATWRLYYDSCLQGIHAKQPITDDVWKYNLTMTFTPIAADIRLQNKNVHTVSGFMAGFTIYRYIQTQKISKSMKSFKAAGAGNWPSASI